ncbi:MAG: 5'-3' exonuclease [Candidatus Nealsonbacteria bacterium DGGOD1a]|nr:MAG: 5'-3' exonuclease [Candidatus Nealsonbacteria bacterium DGGOD1a]
MLKNKTFVVIDGNSVAHRAFHAMPELTNGNGDPVAAVHGFMLALFRAAEDFRPDYLAVCFDTKGGSFRNKEFSAYKAQRPATAPDLIPQLKTIQKLLPELGCAVFALEGFEADDLIASAIAAARRESAAAPVDFFVLTGDYDSLQLVGGSVKAFIINRGIKNAVLYDAAKVKEAFGVMPCQIPAFKALAGDSSDNIPGAPGIGPKAAVEILEKCGSLENFYAAAEKNDAGFCLGKGSRFEKMKNILLENKEKIINFQRLTTMRADAPLGAVLAKCEFGNFSGERCAAALLELGLAGLAKRLPGALTSRNGTLF